MKTSLIISMQLDYWSLLQARHPASLKSRDLAGLATCEVRLLSELNQPGPGFPDCQVSEYTSRGLARGVCRG